jgi:hypothetical protein
MVSFFFFVKHWQIKKWLEHEIKADPIFLRVFFFALDLLPSWQADILYKIYHLHLI